MNSNQTEYTEMVNDQSAGPIISSNQLDIFEPSEFKLTLTPTNENIFNSYSPLILLDSIYPSDIIHSDEKRASPIEPNLGRGSGTSITSFDTIRKKKSLNDFGESNYTTRNTTKKSKKKSFARFVQEPIESNCVCKSNGPRRFGLITASNKMKTTGKSKAKRQKKNSAVSEEVDGSFHCKLCELQFTTSQGLGGHMSRAHPGKSFDYKKKKGKRKMREVDRYRLQLAKKIYFESMIHDHMETFGTKRGRQEITRLLDRKKLKKIKKSITKDELDDFIEDEILYSDGFERK